MVPESSCDQSVYRILHVFGVAFKCQRHMAYFGCASCNTASCVSNMRSGLILPSWSYFLNPITGNEDHFDCIPFSQYTYRVSSVSFPEVRSSSPSFSSGFSIRDTVVEPVANDLSAKYGGWIGMGHVGPDRVHVSL